MFTYTFLDNGSVRGCGIINVRIIWFDGTFYNTYSDCILDDDILFFRDNWKNRVRDDEWSSDWNQGLEIFKRFDQEHFGEIEIDNFLSNGKDEHIISTDDFYDFDEDEIIDSLLDSIDEFLDNKEKVYKDNIRTNKTLDSVVIPDLKNIVLSYI